MSILESSSTKLGTVCINEVVTRDGFQSESLFIDTDTKVEFLNKLSEVGYAKIEVTSFTSPKAIPALADAEEVCVSIKRADNILYTALVPNMRGLERFLRCNLDEVNMVMSASESHNNSNLRRSRKDSLDDLLNMYDLALASGVSSNVSISTAFGCPFEGYVPINNLFEIIDSLAEKGLNNVTLCDTTGMAFPTLVKERIELIKNRYKDISITAHFHNTRGMGLVNCLAALKAGVNKFDSSLGEIGGCPYAPGATGNVCTEELSYMLSLMGWETNTDIEKMLSAAKFLESVLGRKVPGQLVKAGLIKF